MSEKRLKLVASKCVRCIDNPECECPTGPHVYCGALNYEIPEKLGTTLLFMDGFEHVTQEEMTERRKTPPKEPVFDGVIIDTLDGKPPLLPVK